MTPQYSGQVMTWPSATDSVYEVIVHRELKPITISCLPVLDEADVKILGLYMAW